MKTTYILQKSYPSLIGMEVGDEVTREEGMVFYIDKHLKHYSPKEIEGNEFWGFKKPALFTTEDGEEYFEGTFAFGYNVHNQQKYHHGDWKQKDLENFKIFHYEENVNQYIAWYKKELSINDLLLADVGISTAVLDILQRIILERNGYN